MIGNSWDELLKEEFKKEYFQNLMNFVKEEYRTKTIYPKQSDVFNAFRYTDFNDIKVVILGQDPYHGPNQAEGLSFSVSNEVLKPPSLKNIFKELESDLGIPFPELNSLKPWAKEGVLLLNAVLTVEEHNPTSHKDHGWETFTDDVIKIINKKSVPIQPYFFVSVLPIVTDCKGFVSILTFLLLAKLFPPTLHSNYTIFANIKQEKYCTLI